MSAADTGKTAAAGWPAGGPRPRLAQKSELTGHGSEVAGSPGGWVSVFRTLETQILCDMK